MNTRIDLYTWPQTPNGKKIMIALEEMQIPYRTKLVDITKQEQFSPSFLKIAPNNRIPAIIDHKHNLSLFESGAILVHLSEAYDMRFYSNHLITKNHILQWLFWQMGGIGPMLGQYYHFKVVASEQLHQTIPYAINRYLTEAKRLYQVANIQLKNKTYLAGDHYSIADISTYPWILENDELSLEEFPHLKTWVQRIRKRKSVIKTERITQEIMVSYNLKKTPSTK